MNTPSIRYVHANDIFDSTKCPYTGLTICYTRERDIVLFTYSLCHKGDQYSKRIGREITGKTWVSLVENNKIAPDIEFNDSFLDAKNRYGFLRLSSFQKGARDLNVFSDQQIADLDMFSFKHAAISKVLLDYVTTYAVLERFPSAGV